MSTFDASAWIGNRTVRPTDAELTTLQNWARGLGDVPVAHFWRHSGFFEMDLSIAATVNAATVPSMIWTAKFPFKVVAAQVGVESAAGSAATLDVHVKPSGGAFASIFTAAVDVKTGAGTAQDAAILDGSEDVAYGSQIKLVAIGTGAGAVVGSVAKLLCFRL